MPHIALDSHLPGITGLLEYRKDTAAPIRQLTQMLLRGDSTLTEGERELIATVVCYRNECAFCTAAHTAAADLLLGEHITSQSVLESIDTAPVSEKMKYLLQIASLVQKGGRHVNSEVVSHAKAAGATDTEIHDTVLIAALFSLYNRYVDGLGAFTPSDPSFYETLAQRIVHHGYTRLPQGYDHLKNNPFQET